MSCVWKLLRPLPPPPHPRLWPESLARSGPQSTDPERGDRGRGWKAWARFTISLKWRNIYTLSVYPFVIRVIVATVGICDWLIPDQSSLGRVTTRRDLKISINRACTPHEDWAF